jgi:serine/threonine protein kinase
MGCCISSKPEAIDVIPSPPARKSTKHFIENVVIDNVGKDISDYYDILESDILGAGASGAVRKCINKSTNVEYALKTLVTKKVSSEKLKHLKEEIKLMSLLDHPNILRIHEYFESPNVIHLVLELCRGGELLDRLHKQEGHKYSERTACKFVQTMLSAIAYCHDHSIVHRDLKLESIFCSCLLHLCFQFDFFLPSCVCLSSIVFCSGAVAEMNQISYLLVRTPLQN